MGIWNLSILIKTLYSSIPSVEGIKTMMTIFDKYTRKNVATKSENNIFDSQP